MRTDRRASDERAQIDGFKKPLHGQIGRAQFAQPFESYNSEVSRSGPLPFETS